MTDTQLYDTLRTLLIESEGSRLFPYLDTKGKITIGVGHNLSDKGVSQEEVDTWLTDDIRDAERDLDTHLSWWRNLDSVRRMVMIELCFNMGIGTSKKGLRSFVTTLPLIAARRYEEAAANLRRSKWAKDVGSNRSNRICAMLATGRIE